MKSVLAFVSLFLATVAFAAKPIDLSLEMKLNGNASAHHVSVLSGDQATIKVQNKNGIAYQVFATPVEFMSDGKRAVKIDFEVSEIQKDGISKVVSKSQVITLVGERAAISSQSDQGKFELSVVPNL